MFLRPTPLRLTRRSRFEHLGLLFLRCLVFCLLALAFARPFLPETFPKVTSAQPGKKVVILVDTSASMRRGNLWSDAKDATLTFVRNLAAEDQVSLVAFDRSFRSLINFQEWSELNPSQRAAAVQERLSKDSPGWAGTHLANALMNAAEILKDNIADTQKQEQIFLVSDLQQGSRLEGLEGYKWPKGVKLILAPLKIRQSENASIQILNASAGASGKATNIRVINSAESTKSRFELFRQQYKTRNKVMDIEVAPGQSRIVSLPKEYESSPGGEWLLTGDDSDFDNHAFYAPVTRDRIKILFRGDDAETDSGRSLYYLKRALQDASEQSLQILFHDLRTPFTDSEKSGARFMIVTATPNDSLLPFLNEGNTVLFTPHSAAECEALNSLPGLEKFYATEATSENHALLGQIDFQHPLFAPFADPRFSDFTKIHFWKHRRFALDGIPGAKVLARFDYGDAALFQIPIGKGTLLVLASTWSPGDSQLALSSKFVPLLYSMLEQSGAIHFQSSQYNVGDDVQLGGERKRDESANKLSVVKPDGTEVTLAASETHFRQTDVPGIYIVKGTSNCFAVNLPGEESRTAPLTTAEMEALGFPLNASEVQPSPPTLKSRQHLANTEMENQQKLWRILIVVALLILILETWLAGWLTRKMAAV